MFCCDEELRKLLLALWHLPVMAVNGNIIGSGLFLKFGAKGLTNLQRLDLVHQMVWRNWFPEELNLEFISEIWNESLSNLSNWTQSVASLEMSQTFKACLFSMLFFKFDCTHASLRPEDVQTQDCGDVHVTIMLHKGLLERVWLHAHICGWNAWALRADEGMEAVRAWSRMVKDGLRRRVMLRRGGSLGGKEVPVWACFFLWSWGEVAFSVLCLFFSCDLMHSVCLNGCKMIMKSSNK